MVITHEQVAKFEFCIKPAAAIALLHSGIPLNHTSFVATKTGSDIQSLHHYLTGASKVIPKLDLSDVTSPSEEHICDYLITITGNVQSLELKICY